MNVGLLSEGFNTKSQYFGGFLYLMQLGDRLREKGLEVSVFIPSGGRIKGLSARAYKSLPTLLPAFKPTKVLMLNKLLLESIDLFKSLDIIHSISWSSLPSLHLIAKHSRSSLHFIFDCRTSLLNINRSYNVYKLITLRFFKPNHLIFCDSKSLSDYERAFGGGGVTHIPTPVDIDKFKGEPRRHASEEFRILFASSLSREKGVLDLLRAVKHTRQFHSKLELIIAGDGPLRNVILDLAAEREWLKYLGPIEHSKMPSLLNSVDLVAHPSYFEGISRAVLEAMACRVPVITTNVGGHFVLKDVVRLIPPSSPKILSKEILYMLENEDERKRYGREGRRYVEANNSWNNAIQQIIAIYEFLLRHD